MIKTLISRVIDGVDLSEAEAREAMELIMDGGATPAQIAALVTALRMKGETVEEITGCAMAMRARATRVKTRHRLVVDTCGTGGDGSSTFNISTTAAFVVAGAGVTVAKHGNRSVSSRSGSADVLEALGIRLDLTPEQVGRCLDEVGIGFLFAPSLHEAMKHAAGPRREIGIRTIFNLLGPLTNPAGAQAQVVGVFRPELTEKLAGVLRNLGTEHALVVHGGGLDEITLFGPTRISEVVSGEIRTYEVEPEQLGLRSAPREALQGGEPVDNALITMVVLQGAGGPRRDVTLANAGAALVAAGAARNLVTGVRMAADSIDSGRALAKLVGLQNMTRRMAS